MLQNKSNTKTQWEFSSGKTSKITKDLNYLSIIGKVHQIAEKWSLSFSPGLPIETLSAPNPSHVTRPLPKERNSSNWKQPCLAFGLGYFHHQTAPAKTYILPRKTFLWNLHLIQTESWNWLLACSKDSSELGKIGHMCQPIYEIVPNLKKKKKQPCTWTHLYFLELIKPVHLQSFRALWSYLLSSFGCGPQTLLLKEVCKAKEQRVFQRKGRSRI